MNRRNGAAWTILAGLLLLTAALAGCAQQAPGGDDASDDGGDEVSQEQARASYRKASQVFQEGPQDATRVELEMTVETGNASESGTGTVKALTDEDKSLMVMTMEGTFAESSSSSSSEGFEALVVGQVHKTTFFGVPESLLGFYNESETPPEGFTSVDKPSGPGGQGGDSSENLLSDPNTLMQTLAEEPPEDAEFSAREITHNGQAALEIETSYEDENGTFDLRAVVYEDPQRPALIEGTATGAHADGGSGSGEFSLEFTYGEGASHPMEEAVHRLETATFSKGEPGGFGMGGSDGDDRFTNRTIQPSQNPGMLDLEEIQVLATESGSESSGPGGAEPVLTLDAEQGSASSEAVNLSYVDTDDDGAVSPGDEIVLEDRNTSDSKTYSINVEDEQTGVRLAPGPGVLAGVAVLGIAVLVLGRRQR